MLCFPPLYRLLSCFFFTVTASPEIYTLSLHDALPILLLEADVRLAVVPPHQPRLHPLRIEPPFGADADVEERKSTRLNSSHTVISYAVFCLKKKMLIIYESALCMQILGELFRATPSIE